MRPNRCRKWGVPEYPDHLGEIAQKEWQRLVEIRFWELNPPPQVQVDVLSAMLRCVVRLKLAVARRNDSPLYVKVTRAPGLPTRIKRFRFLRFTDEPAS